MKLENYEVHLPNYSNGDKIYDKIGPVCESYGKKVLIIGSRRALKAAEDKIRAYVENQPGDHRDKTLRNGLYLRGGRETARTAGIRRSRYGLWRGWRKGSGYREMLMHHG